MSVTFDLSELYFELVFCSVACVSVCYHGSSLIDYALHLFLILFISLC